MQVSPFLNLKVHVNFKNSVSDIYMHAWLQVQYDQGTWAFEYNSKLKVLWIADIGPGNLRPYGRDRGNLKKLPLTHGEATNKRTTFSIMLWLKKKPFKSFVWGVPQGRCWSFKLSDTLLTDIRSELKGPGYGFAPN